MINTFALVDIYCICMIIIILQYNLNFHEKKYFVKCSIKICLNGASHKRNPVENNNNLFLNHSSII